MKIRVKKVYLTALTCLLAGIVSASKVTITDNADTALILSQSNYNRIFIENDRISDAVFPEKAMGIQRDESDGSLYVMPSSNEPFTLFLSTEGGRHFSVTVQGEEALGKTFELVPPKLAAVKPLAHVAQKKTAPQKSAKAKTKTDEDFNSVIPFELVTHMSNNEPMPGFQIKKQFGMAERWKEGLSLLPRAKWQGKDYLGEVIELYNASSKPLKLHDDWFDDGHVRAMMLSAKTIEPKGRVMLYRVKGGLNA